MLINKQDIRKTKKVYVEWIDSCALGGWRYADALEGDKSTPSKIVSIGFLVDESKTHVLITTSISESGSVMDALSIPKCAILKKKELR